MKTKLIIALLFAFMANTGYGKNDAKELFKNFSNRKNVEKVSLGMVPMKLVGLFTNTMGVNRVEVLSLENCSQEVKEEFEKAVRGFKSTEFETLVSTNENGENTKVLVCIKKDAIRELLVLTTGDDPALVRIQGKIKPSDIEKVTQKHERNGQQ